MRATIGPRRALPWRTPAAVIVASMLALSLLGAGTVFGATPGWTVGSGTDWDVVPQPASGASSTSVSAGARVGFFEWLHNGGSSNISQLYLNTTSSPAAAVAGAVWTIKDAAEVPVRSGSCPTATPLVCNFGALNAGHTVYIVVAFTTGANLSDGAVQSVSFNFNTTGTPPGKNKSHGDATSLTDSVVVTKNGDAAGDFNLDQASITVADNQNLTGQNRQATLATVAGSLTGVAVGDSPNLTTPCNETLTAGFPASFSFSCDQLTSLTSVIEVGNGKTFTNASGGPGIKTLVSFSKMPNQLNGATPIVYHYWVDGEGEHAELITEACTYDSGNLPTNAVSCLTPGNKQVTVWLLHNGNMRM